MYKSAFVDPPDARLDVVLSCKTLVISSLVFEVIIVGRADVFTHANALVGSHTVCVL